MTTQDKIRGKNNGIINACKNNINNTSSSCNHTFFITNRLNRTNKTGVLIEKKQKRPSANYGNKNNSHSHNDNTTNKHIFKPKLL